MLRAGRRRGVDTEVVEWPGGVPSRRALQLKVTDAMLQSVLDGRALVPVQGTRLPKDLVGLPCGTLVELNAPRRTQLVSVGGARFLAGRWRLPVFIFPVEEGDRPAVLVPPAARDRKKLGLSPRRSLVTRALKGNGR